MINIAIITATRAEYGLLQPLIKKLRSKYENDSFRVNLVVTGTHLSDSYGKTINEIINNNVRVDYTITTSINSSSAAEISQNQADVLCKFSHFFDEHKFDAIIILGDRYEMLSIAVAASNEHIPIFHLCGGDTTEGALDEWIRHSITKMSYLHFVTNEDSKNRVVQLGENPDRVFNFGSTSIDNILNIPLLSREEALRSVELEDCDNYAICTFHPVTMENNTAEAQISQLVEAMKTRNDIQFIVTKSNSDMGGAKINELWDYYGNTVNNIHVFTSLGITRYLSLMKYAEFVIGNSSSGIIETPAFHVPTVNIGDRQKGRLRSDSIIDCTEDTPSILKAILQAQDPQFRLSIQKSECKFGNGNSAALIAEEIYKTLTIGRINLKKKFYNLGNQ